MALGNFNEDLAFSQEPEVTARTRAGCRWFFGDELVSCELSSKSIDMRGGDFTLTFEDGRIEYLDLKVRRIDYWKESDKRNCTLEILSNVQTGRAGWTVDNSKLTNWIFYLYMDTLKFYFYDARQLRRTVKQHLPLLMKHGLVKPNRTGGYYGRIVIVDHAVLAELINRSSRRRFAR